MRRAVAKSLLLFGGGALLLAAGQCDSNPPAEPSAAAGAGRDSAGSPPEEAGGSASAAGGNGGTGASSAGNAGTLTGPATILEADRWRKVEAGAFTEPACSLYEAVPERLAFSPLEWSSCGEGCSSADVLQGYNDTSRGIAYGFPGDIGMSKLGDDWVPVFGLSFGIAAPGRDMEVGRIMRLDSGETVGAVRTEYTAPVTNAPCTIGVGSRAVSFMGFGRYLSGFPSVTREAWVWAAPDLASDDPPALTTAYLDVEGSAGRALALGQGAVFKQRLLAESTYETLESSSGSHLGSAQGDLAVWTDYALDHQRIRGWAPDGRGVRTIVENPPDESCDVRVSPTALVALRMSPRAGDLTGKCGYPADMLRLWRIPRAYGASEVAVTESSALPGTPFLASLVATWGDYAVVQALPVEYSDQLSYARTGDSYYLVVRLSTWDVFRVRPTSGRFFGGVAGISDEYFYFSEVAERVGATLAVQRVVRVSLSELNAFGEAL